MSDNTSQALEQGGFDLQKFQEVEQRFNQLTNHYEFKKYELERVKLSLDSLSRIYYMVDTTLYFNLLQAQGST
jgi:hypothetical protein